MEFEIKEPSGFKDGPHEGTIVAVEYRTTPYEYTDLVIESDGKKIKAGFPSLVSPVSKLGMLMQEFGVKLVIGESIEPEKIFIGKEVIFMTMMKGNFANVVNGSLKPK